MAPRRRASSAEDEALGDDDMVPEHDYREATAQDLPAVRRLFDASFPIKYDDRFYDLLEQGVETGSLLGTDGKLVCAVSEREGRVTGAVVMHTMNLSAAKASGKLPFDLLEAQGPRSTAAYILLLAVHPDSRRQGVASNLIYHGSLMLGTKLTAEEGDDLSAVRARVAGLGGGEGLGFGVGAPPPPSSRLTCPRRPSRAPPPFSPSFHPQIFCHTRAGDDASRGLYHAASFTQVGRVPGHYTIGGAPVDAHVWAVALKGSHVATYRRGADGQPPDLSKPQELRRVEVWRAPPWARTLCLHFGLPIGAVVLLYLVCYALVVAGPLRGVGGERGALDPHADVLDEGEFDEF